MEPEMYIKPSRTSAMELLVDNYFCKKSVIVDVCLGSKCTSGSIHTSWLFLREYNAKLLIVLKAKIIR